MTDNINNYLQLSLWGNSVDLSILRDLDTIKNVNERLPPSLESVKELSSRIVHNDVVESATYIYKNRGKRIDIILDNSGK